MKEQTLRAIGTELTRDKWLVFVLVLILLQSYVHTHNEALLQLLVTAVGGFLAMMRGTQTQQPQQQNIASGEGSSVKTEDAPPAVE